MRTLPITKFEIVTWEKADTPDFEMYKHKQAGVDADGKLVLTDDQGFNTYKYDVANQPNLKSGRFRSPDGVIMHELEVFLMNGDNVIGHVQTEAMTFYDSFYFEIPYGCTHIFASISIFATISSRPYTLELSDYCREIRADVTQSVTSWDELEICVERDNTSGTLSEISLPVTFVQDGRDFVRSLFRKNGLHAQATFNIYKRGDHDDNYTLVKTMELNFESYKEYDNKVEIEGISTELVEYVNSAGKNKYDIKVRDLFPKKWKYDRMELLNTGNYMIGEGYGIDVDFPNTSGYKVGLLTVSISNPEMVPGSPEHDMKSQQSENNWSDKLPKDKYFFKAAAPVTMWLRIKGEFRIAYQGDFDPNDSQFMQSGVLVLIKGDQNRDDWKWQWPINVYAGEEGSGISKKTYYKGSVDFYEKVNLAAGEYLRLGFGYNLNLITNMLHLSIKAQGVADNFEALSIEYMSGSTKQDESRSLGLKIDVIKPESLLQKYLDLMSEKPGYFTGTIKWDGKINPMICAAESIRNFPDAYLHGSPIDFFHWMKVLGYEHQIVGRELVFAPRDTFFKRDVKAMELRKNEMADLVVQADSTYACTGVKIGYEKQDYDKVNGRFEANGTFEYKTGYLTKKDNFLELISPYRGDSMGIELLCQERSNSAKDNKADNDIFFVDMAPDLVDGYYKEYKGEVMRAKASIVEWSGPIEGARFYVDTFNARVNPYYLVKYNESLIGINTEKIAYAATDMNKDAVLMLEDEVNDYIPGPDMRENQPITKHLFDPIEYNFAAGHWQEIPNPDIRDGLIYFTYQGERLQGYIKEIRKNYAMESETTWILHAVLKE